MNNEVKTYKFDEPIFRRKDGSYVVQYQGSPYHVCEASVSVTLADVAEYLADKPETVIIAE